MEKLSFPTRREEFWRGVFDTTPLIIGAIPFGIIFGTLGVANRIPLEVILAMSAFVFAGSAQFIAVGLIAAGSGVWLVVVTTFVVNLRHMLYAATLLPVVRHLSGFWRFGLAFGLTDETFAVAIRRYHEPDSSPWKHWYFLGSMVFMYSNWFLCTYLGAILGDLVPNIAAWGLDFAMLVAFIGMMAPYLRDRPTWIAVFVAGTVAVATYSWPHKLGLIAASVAGVVAGVIAESRQQRNMEEPK